MANFFGLMELCYWELLQKFVGHCRLENDLRYILIKYKQWMHKNTNISITILKQNSYFHKNSEVLDAILNKSKTSQMIDVWDQS